MNRIKVINEPSELVPMLRSVDTPTKRDVLKEVTLEWRTADEIEAKYGPEGREAIMFFDKMKLVESRWMAVEGKSFPEKSYHTFYTSFHINAQWPVYEISDVLAAAMMSEEEYADIEARIIQEVGPSGRFSGDVAEALGLKEERTSRLSCDDMYRKLCEYEGICEKNDILFCDEQMPKLNTYLEGEEVCRR